MKKRVLALMLASLLGSGLLAGCRGGQPSPSPGSSEPPSPSVEPTQSPEVTQSAPPEDTRPQVRVALTDDFAAFGAAKLMADNEAGESAYHYIFIRCADSGEGAAALKAGEVDIAFLDTNDACVLYNGTGGGVRAAAVHTCQVWKLAAGGESPTDLTDLMGETLYAAGQGTGVEHVFRYLLLENRLDPDEDLEIEWMTAEKAAAGLAAGESGFALLPLPALLQENSQGLDLAEEWRNLTGGRLAMGCVAADAAFAKEHPDMVRGFLKEYEASLAYMSDRNNLLLSSDMNPGILAERYDILSGSGAAGWDFERYGMTLISGVKSLRESVQSYCEALYAVDPASIGGGIPDDAFYFE